MTDPRPTKRDPKSLAIAATKWLRDRAKAARMRDQITKAAVAASTTAVLASGLTYALTDYDPFGIENAALVTDADALLAKVDVLEADLNSEARLLADLTTALDTRVEALAGAISAGDTVNAVEVERLGMEVAALVEQVDTQAAAADRTARAVEATATDLANVIVNQNTLGHRTEQQAARLVMLARSLADTAELAQEARAAAEAADVHAAEAREAANAAADLASEALDGAASVAEAVAALAGRVDDVASEVAATASRVDGVADRLDGVSARVDGLASSVAALSVRVDDIDQRLQAEEAEPAVVENDYDDTELRDRIAALEVDLGDVTGDIDNLEAFQPLLTQTFAGGTCNDTGWGVVLGNLNSPQSKDGRNYLAKITTTIDPNGGEAFLYLHGTNGQTQARGASPTFTTQGTAIWFWGTNSLYTTNVLRLRCTVPGATAAFTTVEIIRTGARP